MKEKQTKQTIDLNDLKKMIKEKKKGIKKSILYHSLNTFSLPYRLEHLIKIVELRGEYLILQELSEYLGIEDEDETDADSIPF